MADITITIGAWSNGEIFADNLSKARWGGSCVSAGF